MDVARRVVRSGVNPIGEPGGVLFRRADYEAVGGWNGDRRWAMDLDLWIRLLARGRFLGLAEPLAAFRVSAAQPQRRQRGRHLRRPAGDHGQLAATPQLRIRTIDRAVGRLGAPLGRLRRRVLFALSARTSRRAAPGRAPRNRGNQFLWILT